MKMPILAGGFLLAAELSWGAETAPVGAVVGWWRFNESPYKADSRRLTGPVPIAERLPGG